MQQSLVQTGGGGLQPPNPVVGGTIMQQMRLQSNGQPHQQTMEQQIHPQHLPSQQLIITHHHPLQHQQPSQTVHLQSSNLAAFGNPRSYPTSSNTTPFTSPSGSASSSPYVSPSLPSTHSTASQLSLAHLPQQTSHNPAANIEGLLTVGSKVQIRGPDAIHPKLHAYAYSFAEIVQLPVHPVTWYGVRLRDGKNVKLRKSSFDVVSIHPSSGSGGTTVSAGFTPHSQQSSPQHQPQQYSFTTQPQQQYSPYQFSHYQPSQGYNPYSQQQYPHGTTLQVPVGNSKIVYASPSPSPSPLPPSSSSAASTTSASASVATRDMAGLSVSTPHRTERQPTHADPMASEEEYEDLDLNAAGATTGKQTHPHQRPQTNLHQHTRHYPAHASPSSSASYHSDADFEGMSDIGTATGVSTQSHSRTSSTLVLPGKRKPVPRTMSPGDEDGSDREGNGGSTGQGAGGNDGEYSSHPGDEDYDDSQDDEEDEDGTYGGKKGGNGGSGSGKKTQKSLGQQQKSLAGGSASGAGGKSARQRRGRGRALLGLNVVITNGRYKGETGLVVRGANGYYSVKFHRPLSELRQHDNTAMKRSSELAPITPSGKRLTLPIPPAQRKIMKQEAIRLQQSGGGPLLAHHHSSGISTSSNSPRLSGQSAVKRKAGVTFRESVSPRGDRRRRKTEEDLSGTVDRGEDQTDEEQYDDERMYSSGGEGSYDDRPRLSHSRSHSSSSSRSSSPVSRGSYSGSEGSRSPTQTELLSPNLQSYPVSPRHHHTPLQTSRSIPASPHQSYDPTTGKFLPSMSLPPSLVLGSGAPTMKVASLHRSQSPRVAEAAGILMEFRTVVGGPEIPGHFQLSHINKQARPEQWMQGGPSSWPMSH